MKEDRDFSKYTAIVVACVLREDEPNVIATGGVYFQETATRLKAHTEIIGLKQKKCRYIDAALDGMQTAQSSEFFLQRSQREICYLIDQSEAAGDFIEQLPFDMEVDMRGVEFIDGKTTDDGGLVVQVSRRDVIAALVQSFQGGYMQIAGNLDPAETLNSILPEVRIKAAKDAGALELAVGLVTWKAASGEYELTGAAGGFYYADDEIEDW